IVVHRYVGLTIGLVVVMLGLTGSAIVYWRELDRMLNPERSVHETGGTQRSLDEILAIVKAAHPQRPKPWTLEPQYDARSPVYAIYRRPEERGLVYGT